MRIEIAGRFRPFSHTPGTRYLIPRTTVWVEIFPTLLRFADFEEKLPLQGPIKPFTIEQDLEKGLIAVFGKTPSGFFRYFLKAEDFGITLEWEKPFKEKKILFSTPFYSVEPLERLSLGMHKAQDWDLIKRRNDLREIFPIWLRLADWVPEVAESSTPLLKICETRKDLVAFENLFAANFKGLLCPVLKDENYLGLIPDVLDSKGLSSLAILKKSARLIRSLFFQEIEDAFLFLPHLPPQFDAGRFCNIRTGCSDGIDLEWTKKLLRRVVWRCGTTRVVQLKIQSSLHSFRLKRSRLDRGKTCLTNEPISCTAGEILFLDRFQK